MTSKFSVVMIDDEMDFLESYKTNLENDFHIHSFTNPQNAMNFMENFPVDAVVLDYHIPGSCAHETFHELRTKNFDRPVLFLTGEYDMGVKLNSLGLGVEDYLNKPISTSELTAYLLNRIKAYKKRNPGYIVIQNLRIKLDDPHVYVDNELVSLSPKEFEILSLLVRKVNNIVSKREIIEKLWVNVKVEENNVDTHLSNLRKKMRGFTGHIKTIKYYGYVLRA